MPNNGEIVQVSKVLRRHNTGYMHWCPECQTMHNLPDSWTFDGNLESPTFSPSFRQLQVKDGKDCHYIITGGVIHWCADSWHGRSDTQPMVALTEEMW